MRDLTTVLVGRQDEEGMTNEEMAREQEAADQERRELIDAWKAIYRRKGLDPDTYRINWDAVFEGGRGE